MSPAIGGSLSGSCRLWEENSWAGEGHPHLVALFNARTAGVLERKAVLDGIIGVVFKIVPVFAGKAGSRVQVERPTAGLRKGRGPIAAPGLLFEMDSTVPNTARENILSGGGGRGENTVPVIFTLRVGLKGQALENQGRVDLDPNKI